MTVDRLWFDPSEILIDGHWRSLRDRLPVEDPSLGRQVGEISAGGATDIDAAVAAARKARAGEWGRMAAADRGRIERQAPGGHYVAPALIAGLSADHPLAQDEIFGPVQVILPFEDEDEAIAIANGTDYGLVAGVWTANGARAMRMARDLRAGQVFLNDYGAAGGVELPFGGVGKSGHGREKGIEALYGFSVLKTVAAWHGQACAGMKPCPSHTGNGNGELQ